jgi:serine/threonine protein kinase
MLMPPLIRKIEPGDTIGRCRIIRELGRGGVGTVYLATHQTLQIEVALKILSPSLSLENPSLGERFIREAQLAARIRHPNVIAVMDAAHDEFSGAYFIVMEYVGGGSLAWHLRNGPLPEAKALAIVTGIAHALVIAEENRIVHRDIKPENIMLDVRGTSKLADLGLAKQALDTRTSLTIGGSFMGTPAYMSPDQARDAKIADTRDDIYSLGASFYECLTGEPPFQGETPYNIMSELLTKPSPQPRVLRPDLSVSADLICRKMMAKERDLRYPDARALLQDLEHARAYGDSGLDRLDAANFDEDAVLAHQQERKREAKYGVETSSDGVYAEPDDLPAKSPRPGSSFIPPRRANNDVFGAAVLLIALVLVTTLLLAWAGPNHPLTLVKSEWATLTGQQPAPEPPPKPKTKPKEKEHTHVAKSVPHSAVTEPEQHVATPVNPPVETPTVAPTNQAVVPIPPMALPVALPVDATTDTNAVPTNPVMPATAVAPDSAFTAREIAEKSLDPSLMSGTGRAELLKIKGERDESQVTPGTWIFYFFDKSASGHARIVTVNGGKVVKSGVDLADFAAPYSDRDILAEDKVQKDSNDILQIAQGLVPGIIVTKSEFLLAEQKGSVPIWKITLWGTESNGSERKLGEATFLAENGQLFQNNLK